VFYQTQIKTRNIPTLHTNLQGPEDDPMMEVTAERITNVHAMLCLLQFTRGEEKRVNYSTLIR
jgi:hypothetical protein